MIEKKQKYIRIDGTTKPNDRVALVEKYQTNQEIRIALLAITAMNTGHTLTAADTVVFAEIYFTPAICKQAEDRAFHRIGQTKTVNIYYLFGEDTIDEYLFPILQMKNDITTSLLDDMKENLGINGKDNNVIEQNFRIIIVITVIITVIIISIVVVLSPIQKPQIIILNLMQMLLEKVYLIKSS